MIFISYRISDSIDVVNALDRDFTSEFGAEHVFRDKTRLEAGQDWAGELERQARSRRVMLVLVGPGWQTATGTDHAWLNIPRLLNPDDWVRKEVTFALDTGNRVVPVLLNGAKLPAEAWLKNCGLERFARLQTIELRSSEYGADLARLITFLRAHYPELPRAAAPAPGPRRTWTPAVCYPLRPAPHFAGREALLEELSAWAVAPNGPTRIMALVAAGGTGKTAIAE